MFLKEPKVKAQKKNNPEKLDCVLLLTFGKPTIYKLKHNGIYYTVDKQGFMYPTKNGIGKYYIFGVSSRNTFFKIKMDLKTLNCYLISKDIIE